MSEQLAKTFYSIHEGKPFYDKLIKYITSGSIVALVLEKENAVASYRQLIGATDPTKAEDNTIRKLYALDKSYNSVHGSDSLENAELEISIIFGD
jgi:nucleoside-diphosphate kinase